MLQIHIRRITPERKADINLKNESFPLFGRMLPSYVNGKWSYETELLKTPAEDLFPDENYDFQKMEKTHLFIGAYAEDKCIGLAILEKQWHKYLYLADLKINRAFRRQGIATRLLQEAESWAKELNYRGLLTVGQDNNLAACLLYIHSGFHIGGLDNKVYTGTKLDGVADIHFYKDFSF